MKEKFVMASFLTAGVADVATTMAALNIGLTESGIFGQKMAETENMNGAYMYRLAVTSIIVALYAFSKENPSRYSFSIDKATRIANIISWGIVTLNTLNIAAAID